jgi:uncharacterized protein YukE
MQARVDPEELKTFAATLESANGNLREVITHLHTQFDALTDTWQDHLADRFANEFRQTTQAIDHFLNESEQFIPYLRGKAQVIEEAYFGRS